MNKILIIAAHPDDEVLGCGGTLLKHISNGDKVYVLYISEGTSGRHSKKNSKVLKKEILKRKEMAKKASKFANFKIVDFLNLKNLELNNYPHNYLTNIIFQNLKKIKPDTVYTHYEYDLNIDHYQTFLSTYIACRPNKDFRINKLLSFEIPSSTDWGIGSNGRVFKPNYFVDIKKFIKKKYFLLNSYKSELRSNPHPRSLENIQALSIMRGGLVGLNNAEAFLINKIIE